MTMVRSLRLREIKLQTFKVRINHPSIDSFTTTTIEFTLRGRELEIRLERVPGHDPITDDHWSTWLIIDLPFEGASSTKCKIKGVSTAMESAAVLLVKWNLNYKTSKRRRRTLLSCCSIDIRISVEKWRHLPKSVKRLERQLTSSSSSSSFPGDRLDSTLLYSTLYLSKQTVHQQLIWSRFCSWSRCATQLQLTSDGSK